MQLAPSARWLRPSLWNSIRLFASRTRSRLFGWVRPAEKRLRLRESLNLGDKRMVAVIEFDGRDLLVGVSSSAVSLLAELPDGDARRHYSADVESEKTATQERGGR